MSQEAPNAWKQKKIHYNFSSSFTTKNIHIAHLNTKRDIKKKRVKNQEKDGHASRESLKWNPTKINLHIYINFISVLFVLSSPWLPASRPRLSAALFFSSVCSGGFLCNVEEITTTTTTTKKNGLIRFMHGEECTLRFFLLLKSLFMHSGGSL